MQIQKHNVIHYISRLKLLAVIFAIAGFLSIVAGMDIAQAAPCESTTTQTGDNGCMQQNWKEAQAHGFTGDYSAFQKAVDKCQGIDEITSQNWTKYFGNGYTVDSENGNCANAIKSCYVSATDASACQDERVLATIAACNNGDVGAGPGDSSVVDNNVVGCGTDSAIDAVNALQGTNYQTNHGMSNAYGDSVKDSECSGSSFTSQDAIAKCKQNVSDNLAQCQLDNGYLTEDPNGGVVYNGKNYTLGKYDQNKINSCMASKATNDQQCKARTNGQGTWNAVTKKCSNPTPTNGPDQPDKEAGGIEGTIDRVNGKCGAEARVNLIECESGAGDGGATALKNVLRIFVIVLSFGVGIAAVGGIAYSAVQYAGASDNQSNVSAARERIRNIIIGILLYGFILAISNWLIPGGVL